MVHTNKTYRFYSLEWIIKHCTVVQARLGTTVTIAGHVGDVGSTGFGIPVTVNLTGTYDHIILKFRVGRKKGTYFGQI